ncbi:OmpA family protein [Roseivirga sp. BDSF3-8]|uniref:OmpA family protein n=1 Tax=Roseivirga sp. BDSF3-8 TaxID=3241598 RepID=UPI0035322B3F
MSAVDKLRESAAVLQEVDVTEIISSLAMGIADAQRQLDNNSVQQLIQLADPNNGFNGKSLIELGFTPAFYHFQHADVSASISLKMKLKQETSFGISLQGSYSSQKGFNQDRMDTLQQLDRSKERSEFKSSRSFVMEASESNSLRISSQEIKMDQEEGSYTRLENFEQDMREVENVDRVRSQISAKEQATEASEDHLVIRNAGGFVSIYVPAQVTDDEGILKLTDYSESTAIDIDPSGGASDNFNVAADFQTTFDTAYTKNGNQGVTGFSPAGVLTTKGGAPDESILTHYFEFDKAYIDFSAGDNNTNKSYFHMLSKILINDPSARITITGSTDTSGTDLYNEGLSEDRAKALKCWFTSVGVPENQIKTEKKGETIAIQNIADGTKDRAYRFARVRLTSASDYLFFKGGAFKQDATPDDQAADKNKFIYTKATEASKTWPAILLESTSANLSINETSYNDIVKEINDSRSTNKYSAEYRNDIIYALHDETKISYVTYSKSEDSIDIQSASASSSSEQGEEETYLISENENFLSNFKQDASELDTSSSFAVGGSIDFRMARQFEINMEGNASVSARLVSLPAPTELLNEIKANLGSGSTNNSGN